MEVEHVKAHLTKKDKKEMSHFEKFVTDGNEKADELAKAGAMLDERFMAEEERQRQSSRSVKMCMHPCSTQPAFTVWWKNGKTVEELKLKPKEKLIFVDKKRQDTKHRTEWCAQANK